MGNSPPSAPPLLCDFKKKSDCNYVIEDDISNHRCISCKLPKELNSGDRIVINGKTLPSFQSFSVSLSPSTSIDTDCNLHFNPKLKENTKCTEGFVILNSRKNSSWVKEEKWQNMPFDKNVSFEILILVTQRAYEIKVSSAVHYTFEQRVDQSEAHFLYINGDVSVSDIKLVTVNS
ncbi:hypothetical protein Btru_046742 [Bulinus truncatus]|nr:hypothetical protein Btru_046742 [Bulinus truncatus]